MPTFETFAERKRRQARAGVPPDYVYDAMPPQLRHQISFALRGGIGRYRLRDPYGLNAYEPDHSTAFECWKAIDQACQDEVFSYLKYIDDNDNFGDRVLG
jgi:hypothetical protein